MTCGPIVPCRTGSSTDLPVSLSVRVMVPVVTLFPSIAAPHLATPAGHSRASLQKIDMPGRGWQTVRSCEMTAAVSPDRRRRPRSDPGSRRGRAPPSPTKMPGEAVDPVRAARNGWATAPSCTPFSAAKSRTCCSSAAARQSLRSSAGPSAAEQPARFRGQQFRRLGVNGYRALGDTESAHWRRARPASSARNFSSGIARRRRSRRASSRRRPRACSSCSATSATSRSSSALADVMAVQIVELGEVEARRRRGRCASRSNHSIACSVEMISSSPWLQPSRSR